MEHAVRIFAAASAVPFFAITSSRWCDMKWHRRQRSKTKENRKSKTHLALTVCFQRQDDRPKTKKNQYAKTQRHFDPLQVGLEKWQLIQKTSIITETS
jgi:hypothetical protein